jgi:hypothetical protein
VPIAACAFRAGDEGGFGALHPGCILRAPDGELRIAAAVLPLLTFEHDLAELQIDLASAREYRGLRGDALAAWAHRSGRARIVPIFDNGADYPSEGLIRYVGVDGTIGFADLALQVVIPATFTWAHPFQDTGTAEVCQGCRAESDGEHSRVVGGTWSVVDRSGRVTPHPDPQRATR